MFQFFLFIMIICSAIWGSALVFTLLGRLSKRIDSGSGQQQELLNALREEVEFLTVRLGRVEEELEFFKELKSPEDSGTRLLEANPEDQES